VKFYIKILLLYFSLIIRTWRIADWSYSVFIILYFERHKFRKIKNRSPPPMEYVRL